MIPPGNITTKIEAEKSGSNSVSNFFLIHFRFKTGCPFSSFAHFTSIICMYTHLQKQTHKHNPAYGDEKEYVTHQEIQSLQCVRVNLISSGYFLKLHILLTTVHCFKVCSEQ